MKHALLLILLFGLTTAGRGQTPTRTIAVTIDDLPYVNMGDGPYIKNARTATAKILSVLKKHRVQAVAFVNEGKLGDGRGREERIVLLREWVDAGMILGNHTYSHPDFNRLTVEQFQEEIVKGEVVTRQLLTKGFRSRDSADLTDPLQRHHRGLPRRDVAEVRGTRLQICEPRHGNG